MLSRAACSDRAAGARDVSPTPIKTDGRRGIVEAVAQLRLRWRRGGHDDGFNCGGGPDSGGEEKGLLYKRTKREACEEPLAGAFFFLAGRAAK